MRTKCDRLESIKNLNLWGSELEDISIIKDMHNLEVVSLSINKIRTLKDFSNLKFLRELYIRKNMIGDLSEVYHLKKCSSLRTLWLNENPLADNKNYRLFVIKNLQQIAKLDDLPISLEERNNAMNFNEDVEPEESQYEVNKPNDSPDQYTENPDEDEINTNVNINLKSNNKINENKNNIDHFSRQHSDNLISKGGDRERHHPSQHIKKHENLNEFSNENYVKENKLQRQKTTNYVRNEGLNRDDDKY